MRVRRIDASAGRGSALRIGALKRRRAAADGEPLGDPMLARAAMDRLLHDATCSASTALRSQPSRTTARQRRKALAPRPREVDSGQNGGVPRADCADEGHTAHHAAFPAPDAKARWRRRMPMIILTPTLVPMHALAQRPRELGPDPNGGARRAESADDGHTAHHAAFPARKPRRVGAAECR